MRTQRRRHSISDFRYTPLVAALGLALAPNAGATNIAVNDPSDALFIDTETHHFSLRGAITYFNSTDESGTLVNCSGADSITFNANGPFVSNAASPLPTIHCDGLTISGMLLDGTNAEITTSNPIGTVNGLASDTSNAAVLVENLTVDGFTYGAALCGNINSDYNFLHGNQTGLRNDGYSPISVTNSVLQANTTGLFLQGSVATVSGNVIGGNTAAGILIVADQGSTISGNHIGTTLDDSATLPNLIGIVIGNSSGATSIHTVIHDNTISGNSTGGIDVIDFSGIHIRNNHIGTNGSGAGGLGNGVAGIIASCGADLEVSGNTISGNSGSGIILGGAVGTTTISGNKIGVKDDGTLLGNTAYGVLLTSSGCPIGGDVTHTTVATTGVSMPGNFIGFNGSDGINISGSSNNSIVGTGDIPDNKIFSNGGYGVNITSGVNNAITGYLIYGNGGSPVAKNINLGFPGGTLHNDTGDGDSEGPNDGQNYPDNVVATRNSPAGQTTVSFTLDTLPGLYRIDVYSNASSAVPGGDALVGSTGPTFNVVSPGPMAGSVVVSGVTADHFSLLATRMQDSETPLETSEFSYPVANVALVPSVSIAPPTDLNFGPVAVNTDSPQTTITITSNGSAPYTINAINDSSCTSEQTICYGGAFTCINHCAPHTFDLSGPGSACQIQVTFHPTAITNYSTTIAICDNAAAGSPSRTITITGSGVTPPPVVVLPSAFDFGSTLFGTSGPPHRFLIFNPGASAVSIGPATVTSSFVLNDTTCGTSLAPFTTCEANVSFAPTDLGPITGALSIAAIPISSEPSSKVARKAIAPVATSVLSGTGVIQAVLDLPTAIDFDAYTAGTPAIRRTVTLHNNGNAVLSLTNISVTGPFVLTNGCSLNMQPGDSCDVTLDFSASDLGDYSGTLVVVSNAVGGSRTIPLAAHTVAVAAPDIRVSAVSIGFGDSLLGFATSPQRVIISNVGNAPAVLSPPGVSTTDFLVTTSCGLTLAPTSTCFADVSFRPAGFGPRFGNLLVNSNAAQSPNVVSLAGTGCRPFSSASSRFGTRFGCAP